MKIIVKPELYKVTHEDSGSGQLALGYEIEITDLSDTGEFAFKEFVATAETFMKMLIHGRMPAIRTMQR